jgi:glycosyltransferase involved in cell wall biosynthesis
MRILMVTSQLPTRAHPGSMAPVQRQIESIRDLGAHVDVLEIKGIRGLKYIRCLPHLWKLTPGVDLVHAHYGYCGLLARSQICKPVVVSFMGDDLLGTPDASGRVKSFSRAVIAVNRWLARTVDAVIVKSAEMAKIVASSKPYVVPNGVNMQLFCPIDPREARKLLGLAEGKYYILFPGRPSEPRKGFTLAQDVVTRASLWLSMSLELLPLWGVPSERVPLYMSACHALLMTSFWEGSPNAVKEAMACNLPVVSLPVGDVPELIAGVEGCAICPRDAEALGLALARVLRDGQRTTGRAALVHKGLDQESVARQVLMIYQEVLARRRASC